MTFQRCASSVFLLVVLGVAMSVSLPAQQAPTVDPSLFAEMRWRNIGPHRAGRTKAAAGHASQPYTFYIGMVNGGVWKTTDAGRTWKPIFDDQPTGSIGWVVVAPSDPNILYVGSGEGLPRPDLAVGDGIYKSTDAGATWTHLGLRDAQQIPKIAVDPRNPNRLFVAALGHPYGPNEERGIFRSTNGGQTFERVLFKDANTGGKDVDIDPSNPDIVYATMWEQRQGPWENGAWDGTNGGIFKSTDGGTTWKPLTQGLPAGIVNAELAIAPSNPRRVYATLEAASAAGAASAGQGPPGTGIYRSDDAGETWTHITTDTRPVSRINEVVPHVHPKDPDTLIVTDIVSYKSTDGGKTFVPFKGAPGGDDNQNIWWNPNDPNIMLLVIDQGAVVTLNGGQTWSSWFTQPTAALYHVMADNAFPYRVCGGQQDSGSVCVASRGNDGQITFRDWHPVGVEEYGYAAPDPRDPDLVYGGKVTRYDRRTGQVSDVGPVRSGRGGPPTAGPAYRTVRTQPVVFSTVDPRALFYGNNVLWKTLDGGIAWKQISPDLTREKWDVPKSVGTYASRVQRQERGAIGAQVIYTIGPSYIDINRIWIGTDDGVIATTADGGLNWSNVTPPRVSSFMKVFIIDPGRFDPLTAYAAVNTLRLDDMNPHIYRTHDGGKTWKEIVNGIPGGAPVSVVREDPRRKGLLFAGSETQVYVSFDDGDHWQSLRLNMAASSVRDLIIKDDDLVVGTHGRGIWILDDITPLRQIGQANATTDADAILFKPQTAYRVRWNMNTDTPLPPDEPTAPNPPEGAIINYYLKSAATGPVTLEILGGDGKLVRRYSSTDEVFKPDPATINIPLYWFRPLTALSATAGMHRFTWDMHYQPLDGGGRIGGPTLPIAAIGHNTVSSPTTPWVNPGQFTVKLTVNGRSYTQPIVVKQDPRVKTPALAMQQVYTLSKAAYYGAIEAQAAARQARALRDQIVNLRPRANGAAADTLAALEKKIEALEPAPQAPVEGRGRGGRGGVGGGGRGGGAPASPPGSLSAASAGLAGVMNLLQGADVRPTAVQLAAITNARTTAAATIAKWTTIKTVDVVAANATLKAAGLPSLATAPAAPPTTQPAAAPQGAQPFASDRADALSEAARRGDAAKAKELLDAGVDVNTKFRYDRMALSFAADRGHIEVVKLFIERGADLNAKDTFYNATALTWAVNPAMGRTPQHAEVVKLLLQHGAQGKDQALLGALGDAATVKAILEVGGLSAGTLSDALEAATRRKNQEMVTLLEQAGAKPRPEFKMDAVQLARYVGTYQGTGNAAQAAWTITVADGRLAVSPGGSARLTLIARDQTTFGIAEQPGATVTFRLEQDKAMGITVNANGNAIAFTRSGEK
jgi:photosystem II stability/assembly factor-like uncharacterized protein